MSRSVLGDVGCVGAPALCARSAARTSVETVAPGAHEVKEAPSAHPASYHECRKDGGFEVFWCAMREYVDLTDGCKV